MEATMPIFPKGLYKISLIIFPLVVVGGIVITIVFASLETKLPPSLGPYEAVPSGTDTATFLYVAEDLDINFDSLAAGVNEASVRNFEVLKEETWGSILRQLPRPLLKDGLTKQDIAEFCLTHRSWFMARPRHVIFVYKQTDDLKMARVVSTRHGLFAFSLDSYAVAEKGEILIVKSP